MKYGLAVALTLFLLCPASGAELGPELLGVVRPDVAVHGRSQGEWSVTWWQWAASFEYSNSPVADMTGERCGAGQEGPVWFLAGAYGSAPVKRHCRIPTGKYVFFPIVNYMVSSNPTGSSSCEEVTAQARELTNAPEDLTLRIDGVAIAGLPAYRQMSPGCFNLGSRSHRNISPTAANGYFVMLQPLKPGHHTLQWGGRLDSISQGVVYVLEVGDVASVPVSTQQPSPEAI